MTATYPAAIKDFVTYVDQPAEPSIIYAQITNDINDEVISIEKTMGQRPYLVPRTKSLGESIVWLYYNKAWMGHTHLHFTMAGLGHDDHSQYVRTDGTRGFSKPEVSPPAWLPQHLLRLDQIKQHSPAQPGDFITTEQLFYIFSLLLSKVPYPVKGVPSQPSQWGSFVPLENTEWVLIGGWTTGYTDYNGNIYVSFNNAFTAMVQSFVFMRMPVPGRSHYGYVYEYLEDQLMCVGISNQGAIVQFREDNPVDRSAWVTMSWIAIGI